MVCRLNKVICVLAFFQSVQPALLYDWERMDLNEKFDISEELLAIIMTKKLWSSFVKCRMELQPIC